MSLSSQSSIAALVRQSAEANALLMQGDAERYHAMMRWTDDFVLFSPFGGTPSRGRDYTAERVAAMGRFFRNGSFQQEVVEAWGTADMVTLATIERAHVEIGGLPAQDWALRVTLVFRREDPDGFADFLLRNDNNLINERTVVPKALANSTCKPIGRGRVRRKVKQGMPPRKRITERGRCQRLNTDDSCRGRHGLHGRRNSCY